MKNTCGSVMEVSLEKIKIFDEEASKWSEMSLSYRIFSDTLLPVFFFLMGSMEDAQKLKSFFLSSNSSE